MDLQEQKQQQGQEGRASVLGTHWLLWPARCASGEISPAPCFGDGLLDCLALRLQLRDDFRSCFFMLLVQLSEYVFRLFGGRGLQLLLFRLLL